MPLSDYAEPSVTVPFTGGSFVVYPLLLSDVIDLIAVHREDIETAMDSSTGARVTPVTFLRQYKDIALDAIALATREDGARDIVRKLPVGVQLAALVQVYRLIDIDVETVGNVVREITHELTKFTGSSAAPPLNASSDAPADTSST